MMKTKLMNAMIYKMTDCFHGNERIYSIDVHRGSNANRFLWSDPNIENLPVVLWIPHSASADFTDHLEWKTRSLWFIGYKSLSTNKVAVGQ